MICLICGQAETVDGLTSAQFERREMRLVVNNVPAQVCPSSGEAYVKEQVAVSLLRGAEELSAAGEDDGIRDYRLSTG